MSIKAQSTITLAGRTYPVRVTDGGRFVQDGTKWIKATEFVDWLIKEGKSQELADLIKIGTAGVFDTYTFGSPQQTANQLHGGRQN